MSTQHGTAGASARALEHHRHVRRMVPAGSILVIGFLWLAVLPRIPNDKGLVSIVAVFAFLMLLKVVMGAIERQGVHLRKREKQAARGAVGEENVARILETLPDEWEVFHDVKAQYGDIDYVLLSPTKGVMVIETKAHGGKVTLGEGGKSLLINGRKPEKDFIRQCHRNLYWVRDAIKNATGIEAWIQSILVFPNAFVEIKKPIRGVSVINSRFLPEFIRRRHGNRNAGVIWGQRHAIEKALGLDELSGTEGAPNQTTQVGFGQHEPDSCVPRPRVDSGAA